MSKFKLSCGFSKYPPNRGAFIKSPYTWIQGKAEADAVWPYWRVHDKLYNLTSFIPKHPGGELWLKVTQGTDVTESFESSHLGPRSYSTLKHYYVKDAETKRNSPFTFKENGFFMTLKKKVTPILLDKGKGPTVKSYMILDTLLLIYLTLFLFGGWCNSATLLLTSGVVLSLSSLASHNFIHQKDNWRMHILEANLLSTQEYRILHAISHHTFPNTIYDYEIELYEPYLQFLPHKDKPRPLKLVVLLMYVLVSTVNLPLDSLRRLIITRKHYLMMIIPVVQAGFLLAISPTITRGILNVLILHGAASFIFNTSGVISAHHHPEIFREGDLLPKDRDWGLLQVFATRDKSVIMRSTFLSMIAFGNHTLHHLFPTVDHSKLPLLLDPLVETCAEFGIHFKLMTMWDLIKGPFLSAIATDSNNKLPDVLRKPHSSNQ